MIRRVWTLLLVEAIRLRRQLDRVQHDRRDHDLAVGRFGHSHPAPISDDAFPNRRDHIAAHTKPDDGVLL